LVIVVESALSSNRANFPLMRADNYDDRVTTTTMAGLVACFG
jgi:hypothetical protein